MNSRDKDIKFPEKKVDSNWKEQISKDRTVQTGIAAAPPDAQAAPAASAEFMNFLKSLATQALMSLGEIPNPMSGQSEVDLATAKEMIDLLTVLKHKTKGNCSPEEGAIFEKFLPQLQLKFSQQS